MSKIGPKDSNIELLIRGRLYQHGFGYRKNFRIPIQHKQKLIRPEADVFLSRYKAVILVNGCYWHNHGCRLSKKPLKDMSAFWRKKLGENVKRDRRNIAAFNNIGLKVMSVWECSLRDKKSAEIDYVVKQLEDWIQFGVGNADIPSH